MEETTIVHATSPLFATGRFAFHLSNSPFHFYVSHLLAVTFHEMYRIAAQAALDEAGARKRRAAAGRALAQRNREMRLS